MFYFTSLASELFQERAFMHLTLCIAPDVFYKSTLAYMLCAISLKEM